jgi:hypothetical protein
MIFQEDFWVLAVQSSYRCDRNRHRVATDAAPHDVWPGRPMWFTMTREAAREGSEWQFWVKNEKTVWGEEVLRQPPPEPYDDSVLQRQPRRKHIGRGCKGRRHTTHRFRELVLRPFWWDDWQDARIAIASVTAAPTSWPSQAKAPWPTPAIWRARTPRRLPPSQPQLKAPKVADFCATM